VETKNEARQNWECEEAAHSDDRDGHVRRCGFGGGVVVQREGAGVSGEEVEWIGTYKPATNILFLRKAPALQVGVRVLDRGGHSKAEVVDAIGHMGTNGVQTLVQWASYEPAGWRFRLQGGLRKLPRSWRNGRFCSWLEEDRRGERASVAVVTLSAFSRQDLPMEMLERIGANPKTPYAAKNVRQVLSMIQYREGFAPREGATRTNDIRGIHYGLKPEFLPEADLPTEPRGFEPLPH
jgi:hypothetical protein